VEDSLTESSFRIMAEARRQRRARLRGDGKGRARASGKFSLLFLQTERNEIDGKDA
jgi:hypothetical protein